MPEATSADDVFSFCLHSGEMLLRNGSPSANVTQAMLAVARTSGFAETAVNITMGQIVLSYLPSTTERPVTRVQNVGVAALDVHSLTVVEHIVEDVVTSRITVTDGLKRLDELAAEAAQSQVWKLTGSAAMGIGFAWLLGGALGPCLLAGICAVIIEALATLTARIQLPSYYARALAGGLAVCAASAMMAMTSLGSPGIVITAAVVTQLAGSTSVSAIQDLLTGWMLTASGRLLESMLMTAGLAVGAIGAVFGVRRLGIRLDLDETIADNPNLVHTTCAAALIACGFALLSHTRWRHLPALVVFAALGHLVYSWCDHAGVSAFVATSLAAMVLGITTVVFARPARLPTSGALDISIVPLVPGMALYQGLTGIATHNSNATSQLFQATSIALTIGTGAVLGQFIASRTLWSLRSVQYRHASRRGDVDLDDVQFAAQGLSTPDFRRPFTDGGEETPQA